MDGNLFGLNPAGKLLYLQVLGLEIREVRVVAREDIRKTERQQMHASRDSHTQVTLFWFFVILHLLRCIVVKIGQGFSVSLG